MWYLGRGMNIKKFVFLLLVFSLPLAGFSQSALDRRGGGALSIPFVDVDVRSADGNQETAFSLKIHDVSYLYD